MEELYMSQPWRSESWWTSNYNFKEMSPKLPSNILVHDATLRDGEQTPGVILRKEEKLQIAQMLDEVGIHRIEAGMPAVSAEDAAAIRMIKERGLKAKIYAFVRAAAKDIALSKECGVDGVVIEVPIGKPKLEYQFKWTAKDVLDRSVEAILEARRQNLEVVYFPYDTTRADWDDLEYLLSNIMKQAKPDSVGIVDTTGCATAGAIKYLVTSVKDLTGLPIEIHTHNDIGVAVANELAAVEAGAEVVHGCVNGLGERAGNAAIEEIVTALKVLYGIDMGIDFSRLKEMSDLVAKLTGFPMSPNKPIVGSGNFTRESGIGIDMLFEYPLAMFSLNPEFVGQKAQVVVGKKSGAASITTKADELGVKVGDSEEVQKILQIVKNKSIEMKRILTDDEFKAAIKQVQSEK
jgi:isopropylmalate/homocitrate/citramalate synthase